jgi:hypothetical protein
MPIKKDPHNDLNVVWISLVLDLRSLAETADLDFTNIMHVGGLSFPDHVNLLYHIMAFGTLAKLD